MTTAETTFLNLSSEVDSSAADYGLGDTLPEDATVIAVDTTEDIVADDGVTSLREAIDFANTTDEAVLILLSEGTYSLSITGADEDSNLTGDLDILNGSGEVAIVGIDGSEDVVINAEGLGDRVFDIEAGADVTLSNLIITGGEADNGGAIYNSGTLEVSESIFEDNTATNYGGAIYNEGAVTVSKSYFVGNLAQWQGGAIYNATEGALTVSQSYFEDNSLIGDPDALGVPVILDESILERGGAIYNAGVAIVSESSFVDNSSLRDGGAIYNYGTLTVSESYFKDNWVNGGGGAIANKGATVVSQSVFVDNSSGYEGGAITNRSTLEVSESIFINNSAAVYGGAIMNFTADFNGDYSYGATEVSESIFVGNSSSDGGAIYNSAGTVLVNESTFVLNSAENGGAIKSTGSLEVGDSTFVANSATGDGGAIFNDSEIALVLLGENVFKKNQSDDIFLA